MKDWQTLTHVTWDGTYHLVIVPKYRRKVLYGHLRRPMGELLRQLCRQKGGDLLEGHAMPDHVHRALRIPPKYSVAMVVGYRKSAISIHRQWLGVNQGFTGQHFWSRGYCVSTVGLDEGAIRAYVRDPERLDRQDEVSALDPESLFVLVLDINCNRSGY